MAQPNELEIHLLHTTCESARLLNSCAALSIRQRLMVALVLNRWDWLWDIDYSMLMAIETLGSDSVNLVFEVERAYYRHSI
jgi:hypothetical protein